MILSNLSIHEALDQGWLKITPEPFPRKLGDAPGKCPYQTSAVDLRLGSEIAYFKEGIPAQLDLRKGDFNTIFGPMSETRTLSEEQPYVLRPNKLVLGKTLERVELPILETSVCLAARVEGKSSYARCGLLVHFTAPTVHAGFAGTITLELINLGHSMSHSIQQCRSASSSLSKLPEFLFEMTVSFRIKCAPAADDCADH